MRLNKALKKVTVMFLVAAIVLTGLFNSSSLLVANAASQSYTKLESIGVSGGCFNTGIKINQNYSIEMTFSLNSLSQYKNIYLAQSSRYPVYRLRLESTNGLYATHGWYNTKVFTPTQNTDITVQQKKNVTYINGKQVLKATLQSLEATSTLTFGDFNGNIKSFKLWDASNNLVASYEPVKDTSGKACMYDSVNDKFIYYSGTCTAGKEIVSEEEKTVETTVSQTTTSQTTVTSSMTTNEKAVYNILKDLLVNNDSTRKTISQYKLTYDKVAKELWTKVKQDCFLEYHASAAVILTLGKNSDGYATYCELWYTDDDYSSRLEKLKEIRDKYVSSVTPSMTDAEKVLLAHEYIIDNCQYSSVSGQSIQSSASGALVNGYARCGGYTNALIFLLHYVGVDAVRVGSSAINHTWAYVNVDGEWYHVDPTWDDTRKNSSGAGQHRFLLVNDKEIQNIAEGKHYDWSLEDEGTENITSTSSKYSNWFVHNVSGSMYYYNGLWYYYDSSSKSIKASDIEGNNSTVIVSKTDRAGISAINGITNGVLKYTANGTTYKVQL